MSNGNGCRCEARSQSECGCHDVDWTPQELIEARAEIARLRSTLEASRVRDAGRDADHTMLLALLLAGRIRWLPMGTVKGSSVLVFGGSHYTVFPDETGCPKVPDAIRASLKAVYAEMVNPPTPTPKGPQ